MNNGMEDWKRIKLTRTDMSEYVMHCTRARVGVGQSVAAYQVLKEILNDGFFKATFVSGRARPGVRGPYPAVCFTEQPLRFFMESVKASSVRYTEFAIAVRKDDLYCYGGRPVIYSDDSILGTLDSMGPQGAPPWVYQAGLPAEAQHLWVNYVPTALWARPYPLDWTHEREWRARPSAAVNHGSSLACLEDEAVPVRLPTDRSCATPDVGFVVLVDSQERKADLRAWIDSVAPGIESRGGYWMWYADGLRRCPIMSFEVIKAAIEVSGALGRLEDYFPVREE